MFADEKLRMGLTLGGRYLIRSKLGTGGMGAVYLADDLKITGKQWAVKETLRHSHNPAGFDAEAAVLARLDHPFLPKMVDFIAPNSAGFSYLVMDYVRGETLQDHFARQSPLPWTQAVRYASQLCDLFGYLHELRPKPIVYRDLKPTNIMIDEQDNVRLIDFGIARAHTEGQGGDTMQLGTVGFAAPEQFSGSQTDARTDLYTLGAMLYYLLSGGFFYRPEFTQPPQAFAQLPAALTAIIGKLLETNPDRRYQQAADVKDALQSVLFPQSGLNVQDAGSAWKADSQANPATRRLVVVGSLYPGAGATFVTLALAQILDRLNIHHAVIESPFGSPELYHLLNGEFRAPDGYTFAFDEMLSGFTSHQRDWTEGCTTWIPSNPLGNDSEWKMEHWYKLLFFLQQQVLFVDIGNRWDHTEVIELCGKADDLIAVYGPHPAKLNGHSSQQLAVRLLKLEDEGHSVRWVANRDCDFAGRKEWMGAFPVGRSVRVPEIPYVEILNALWSRKGWTRSSLTGNTWLAALQPLAESIGGVQTTTGNGKKRNGIFKFLEN